MSAMAALLLLQACTSDSSRPPDQGRSEAAVASELGEPAEVPDDGVLSPGVRYRAPLRLHCGMDWLHLAGERWRRSDHGPEVETGAGDDPPTDWPVVHEELLGVARLTEQGVVEYSVGGEVVATYTRTRERPPGCD